MTRRRLRGRRSRWRPARPPRRRRRPPIRTRLRFLRPAASAASRCSSSWRSRPRPAHGRGARRRSAPAASWSRPGSEHGRGAGPPPPSAPASAGRARSPRTVVRRPPEPSRRRPVALDPRTCHPDRAASTQRPATRREPRRSRCVTTGAGVDRSPARAAAASSANPSLPGPTGGNGVVRSTRADRSTRHTEAPPAIAIGNGMMTNDMDLRNAPPRRSAGSPVLAPRFDGPPRGTRPRPTPSPLAPRRAGWPPACWRAR